MEKLAIVLLTAKTHEDRAKYARATLGSVLARLKCDSCEMRLYIGDDGSGQEYQNELLRLASSYNYDDVILIDSGRTGYGSNYNCIMRHVHEWADYILPIEDDWELRYEFDIDPIVRVLKDGVFDSVRMGYIGYTNTLYAKFVWCNELHWLELEPTLSHEPHVFSGHPRLETVAYQQRVGPWPEGLSPGETEWKIATTMPEARKRVAWPLTLMPDIRCGAWAHIGTIKSY